MDGWMEGDIEFQKARRTIGWMDGWNESQLDKTTDTLGIWMDG